jgi:hypothetical protein
MTNLTHNSFFLYVYFNSVHVSSTLVLETWSFNIEVIVPPEYYMFTVFSPIQSHYSQENASP